MATHLLQSLLVENGHENNLVNLLVNSQYTTIELILVLSDGLNVHLNFKQTHCRLIMNILYHL